MAIFRCNTCGYLREIENEYTGRTAPCPKCQTPVIAYNSVLFIQKVLQKYRNLQEQLVQLQAASISAEANTKDLGPVDLSGIDIHNSTIFTAREWQQPILDWFAKRDIQVEVSTSAVDTSGFFDEAAVELGDNYSVLKEVSEKIARSQRGDYTSISLNLSKHSQKDLKDIQQFCQNLYQYSFLAKYFYQKNDKRAHLKLQTASPIVQFFNGEWLEWYGFMKLISLCQAKGVAFSCIRSLVIRFPNGDQHELDLFFLVNGTPICVECKSGEFRAMIDKYSTLRKRLNLEKNQFWLLSSDLDDAQAQGFSAMYDLEFLSLIGIETSLTKLLQA